MISAWVCVRCSLVPQRRHGKSKSTSEWNDDLCVWCMRALCCFRLVSDKWSEAPTASVKDTGKWINHMIVLWLVHECVCCSLVPQRRHGKSDVWNDRLTVVWCVLYCFCVVSYWNRKEKEDAGSAGVHDLGEWIICSCATLMWHDEHV